jgi:ABC-type methionine transport system permease subunit
VTEGPTAHDREEAAYRDLAARARRTRVAVVAPCLTAGLVGGVLLYLFARSYVFTHGLARISWIAGILSGIFFAVPFVGSLVAARALGRSLVRSRADRWATEAAAAH